MIKVSSFLYSLLLLCLLSLGAFYISKKLLVEYQNVVEQEVIISNSNENISGTFHVQKYKIDTVNYIEMRKDGVNYLIVITEFGIDIIELKSQK